MSAYSEKKFMEKVFMKVSRFAAEVSHTGSIETNDRWLGGWTGNTLENKHTLFPVARWLLCYCVLKCAKPPPQV